MLKPVQSAVIGALMFAALVCSAQPRLNRQLAHLPPAVQRTIRQQKGNGKLDSIEKDTDGGVVIYDVEVTRGGRSRSFTVDESGKLLDVEVFLDELPPAVRRTIQTVAGSNTVEEIDKSVEDGDTTYDVEVTLGDKTRSFTIGASGRLIDAEIFMQELPAAVQAAIQKEAGSDKPQEIRKCVDGDEVTYDVELAGNGHMRTLSFDPDGQLWYDEQDVNLSDAPEPVQKQIKTFAGAGKVVSVSKIVEDGDISYDAEVQDGEQEKAVSVSPDGKVIPDTGS